MKVLILGTNTGVRKYESFLIFENSNRILWSKLNDRKKTF